MDKREKKRLAILDVLSANERPLGSSKITDILVAQGVEISERTVRLYLQELDKQGMTENLGRRGRRITEGGMREAGDSRVLERMGFLSGKIDTMAYRMDFDPTTQSGHVVLNLSLLRPSDITTERRRLIGKVFAKSYAMGKLMALFEPGEIFCGTPIPEDMIGIGTVCSITLNGVLLRRGIPTVSRFGGLLELANGRPTRFVELINYDGTSIDPLEVFIRSGMADYIGAVTSGNGKIGASFREFPAESIETVHAVAARLEAIGLGSLMCLGNPGQSIYGIPVGPQRIGAVIIGGLNPMSIFEETGLRVQSRALSGLVDFRRLFHYSEFRAQLDSMG
ncbi:MAG: NrpR regulatory domain-containing protein [Kiritimatiellaceae bacterium]|nr:NrpR regulatory domain-containing protein [Kiritimatiellaceae bacterium]